MDCRIVRRFRDGTLMIEMDGKMSIVNSELHDIIKDKNWPELAARKLKEAFPHIDIEFIDEDQPGISIRTSDGKNKAFCSWAEDASFTSIYASALKVLGVIESDACKDAGYFITNYINTKEL